PDHVLTLTGRANRRDNFGSAKRVGVLRPFLVHGTKSSFATIATVAEIGVVECRAIWEILLIDVRSISGSW
ncbi:MAG: hypothetical protein VYE71_01000, partial [Pseudomonadota bacterium]|nr:hypothetical protein [Pseudomonadota bacterium]